MEEFSMSLISVIFYYYHYVYVCCDCFTLIILFILCYSIPCLNCNPIIEFRPRKSIHNKNWFNPMKFCTQSYALLVRSKRHPS